ncbi:MAG: hypothetical protein ACE5IJ_05260 [Thermoplasmata archaeon]
MSVERADCVVTVPQRAAREGWTKEEAQRWAREEVLHGGPPEKPTYPETGEAIDWSKIKHLVGKKVRIRARPMGLIVQLTNGSKRYYPGDAIPSSGATGFALGTTTEEMRRQTRIEDSIREFATQLVSSYNKDVTKSIREQEHRPATYEFWQAGKSIRDFLSRMKEATQDQVWFALEQWGSGAAGYGKRWLEYATYFYDWKKRATNTDAVFNLSETRVMNILQATKKPAERERLAQASLEGPFNDFSDQEFKWVTGQSPGTFPLDAEAFGSFQAIGRKVARGDQLTETERAFLKEIQQRLALKNHRQD